MDPRDQTFLTIHNLTPDANICFASESITDILGYQPHEVLGRSCFDYFHPDEVPFARSVHSRGVLLDKAAVLQYARIRSRDGRWISCECCFTIVHDVLVACTSIYLQGVKSDRRAFEAPQVRRLFSCSPRDPRYHMLEHLSSKFKMPSTEREPRAALILNRFTRNLSIMFATNAVSTILGLSPDEIRDKSFYEFIQGNCLQEAIKCLESAKANESIAYLRFWFRDPREADQAVDQHQEDQVDGIHDGTPGGDEQVSSNTSDSEGGGAQLDDQMDLDGSPNLKTEDFKSDIYDSTEDSLPLSSTHASSQAESGAASKPQLGSRTCETPLTSHSSTTAAPTGRYPPPPRFRSPRQPAREPTRTFELEAVVSCSSDGLVVVLRRARPLISPPHATAVPVFNYENGLFAAPWGVHPIQPDYPPELLYDFRAPLLPQYMPMRDNIMAAGGPPVDQLMSSIREVAVFAWALVGINGHYADYGRGIPGNVAQPPDGLPVWDPTAGDTGWLGPQNETLARFNHRYAQKASAHSFRGHDPGPVGFPPGPRATAYHIPRQPSMNDYSFGRSPPWLSSHHYNDQPLQYQMPQQHHHNPLMLNPAEYFYPQSGYHRPEQHYNAHSAANGHAFHDFHNRIEDGWADGEASHTYDNPNRTSAHMPNDGDPGPGFRYS